MGTVMQLAVGTRTLNINEAEMEKYLSDLHRKRVKFISAEKLGEGFHNAGFLLNLVIDGSERKVVMRIVRGDTGWSHDYLGDRASVLLLQHRLFNMAPEGTSGKSIDVACLLRSGSIVSIGEAEEALHLVEVVDESYGKPYVEDLFQIARTKEVAKRDLKRCEATAQYLASLHKVKWRSETLYKRHIRDLIGHGEMLMGVIDSYPDTDSLGFITRDDMAWIEEKAVAWRNKVKHLVHRLSRIHGDFHPFGNIRFRQDDSILALDQARAEYGEPADDVTCLSINYIFFSVWHHGRYGPPFSQLFEHFMKEYMERTGDEEMLKVMAPFYAFRGLVVTHPLYYPRMEMEKRKTMLNFIRNVLESEEFDPRGVGAYLEE